MTDPTEVRFNVRMNPDLHALITAAAKAQHRSLNSFMLSAAENALEREGIKVHFERELLPPTPRPQSNGKPLERRSVTPRPKAK